jgi:predicted nucleotidyltransferase
MNPSNKEIIVDYKNNINVKMDDVVSDLILFGSRVSGTNNVASDYDLLIVTNKKLDWRLKNKIEEICYQVDLKYNIISDTHILSSQELNTLAGRQPIFVNAIQYGLHA